MPAVPAPPNPLMEVLRRLGMTLPLPQSPEESALAQSGGVAQSIRDIGGLFKGMVTGPKMSGPADAQDLGGVLTMLAPFMAASKLRRPSGLPMDEAARIGRAKKMGFNIDAYHGTKSPVDFPEFSGGGDVYNDAGDLIHAGSGSDLTAYLGDHFAPEPGVANKFAEGSGASWLRSRFTEGERPRVMPVKLRGKYKKVGSDQDLQAEIMQGTSNDAAVEEVLQRMANDDDNALDVLFAKYDADPAFRSEVNAEALDDIGRMDEPDWSIARELADQYKQRLSEQGIAGLDYRNTVEGGRSLVAFDPKNIRSRFAAFDPSKSNSSDLLASIVAMLGLGGVTQNRQR